MKLIQIMFDDECHYVVKPEDFDKYISAEIESLLDGEFSGITLSVVEMTEEEYNALPEFQS